MDRAAVLRELRQLRSDVKRLHARKREIGRAIAAALGPDDLEELSPIPDALRRAAEI
jgi:hypothetical protein